MRDAPFNDRKRPATGAFYSGKTAAGKSLAAFRERKEKKFKEKAKLIRQYKKVVKSEGYDNSVKKPKNPTNDDEDQFASRKRIRPDPFSNATKQAEENKRQRESSRAEFAERQCQVEKRQANRKRRAEMLSKKTKKGQPIMKNVVKDLLEKLQKEHK